MSVKVQIPPPMREATGGLSDVETSGGTIEAVLKDLIVKHPAIGPKLFKEGKLQMHVNIYLNDEDIRFLDDLQSPVKEGDLVALIPAVAGG
ncbi:MoaD/ThiS family protein [Telmatocola sphagniphila]|jgi:molybdopterin converting factor small subunit|uniref:MoaD/ThiS family protein n=1 Tax=Telmatocola sphagniphila TaxID=1123043 RepID=A0A8E6EXM9_9BACT|nr:MoaD/ThiS family protein [Telmatocola sphagniphila]QVL31451.1 MoaD/ThiS family protein [Telmatocola sphagniphila]